MCVLQYAINITNCEKQSEHSKRAEYCAQSARRVEENSISTTERQGLWEFVGTEEIILNLQR